MRFSNFLAVGLLPMVLSCAPPIRRQESVSGYPRLDEGDNATSDDPATVGYFSNHIGLNTNNLTASMDFYRVNFGFRHLFTYHMTQYLSIAYLGRSQGGRNGSAFQTTEELIRFKQNSAGLIELSYFNTTAIGGVPIEGPNKRTSTLSHIGMVVPDSEATQKRLEENGVTIYKKLGEPWPSDGPIGTPFAIGDATNLSPEAWEEIKKAAGDINLDFILCEDPDGNLIEIQPFHEQPLFG